MLWILDLANCLFLDYCWVFFRDFSLALLIQSSSPAFWFCLTFSASRHLGETVTYYSQEGVFLCGNILIQTAHAQCYWGRGAESDMNAKVCLFVRGLLAAITLLGGGGAWAGAGYEVGHSICSVAVTVSLEAGADPTLLEQKPWRSEPSWLYSLWSVCFLHCPHHWDPHSRALKQVGHEWALGSCQPQTKIQAVSGELPV